jgi:small subunit ribosomal protein S20
MAITRSAKKAHRSAQKKRVFNQSRKNKASQAVKTVKKLIAEGKKKEAVKAFQLAQKTLDKAAKAHTLDKNTASRKKSRLAKMIKKLG